MEYAVKMTKSPHYGNRAESVVILEELPEHKYLGGTIPAKRVLTFSTSKDSRGNLYTCASVCVEHRHEGYSTQEHALFADFMQRFNQQPCKVATVKAVETAHRQGMASFNSIVAAARAHYAPKETVAA